MTIPTQPTELIGLCRLTCRIAVCAALLALSRPAIAEEPKVVSGLKNPESVVVGPDGKIYVSQIGEPGKDGDGSIVIVDPAGKITSFATGLDDPKGLLMVGDDFYVADVKKVWRVNAKGKVDVFVAADAFPRKPLFLNDLAYDGQGNFYVSDAGDRAGAKGAVYRITIRGKVTLVLDAELTSPQISVPNGVMVDDVEHLFVADYGLGELYRYDLITGTAQRVSGGFGGTDGIASDGRGGLYVSDGKNGRIFQFSSELEPPRLISSRFQAPADIAVTPNGRTLLVPDMKAGTLTFLPIR
jgi:gluconolactonase